MKNKMNGMHPEHHMHHQMMIQDLKKRFIVSSIITIPILLLSPMAQMVLGVTWTFKGNTFLLFIFASILFFYGGYPFFRGLVEELKLKKPGMMTLIALAISIAYLYSVGVLLGLSGSLFFEELATLIDVMLLGHLIEMRSLLGASQALGKLTALLPATAHVLKQDDSVEDVEVAIIKKGDRVLIKPGEKISADGVILEGTSEVNEAALTGESKFVFKEKGDLVIAGSLNQAGSLIIKVEKDQHDTYIARVINMVKEVMASKSGAQDVADKAAYWLTIVALIAGFVTFIAWIYFGGILEQALEHTVAVMVTTCPHALGLAIPLVIATITAITAQRGILIRNRRAFESMYAIDMVVFDKTGTLTEGVMHVSDVVALDDLSEEEVMRIAATVSVNSEHSISKAIVAYAHDQNIKTSLITDFKAIFGKGIKADADGKVVLLGNEKLLQEEGIAENLQFYLKKLEVIVKQGKTGIFLVVDAKIKGIIAVEDKIRESSFQACEELNKNGIKIAMITGDNHYAAEYVAKQLGIAVVLAEVLPQDKASEIKKLQAKGYTVAMVGDGINDAPALTTADIGIAIGAGTDVAIESADIVLIHNDPRAILSAMHYAKVTRKKMIQNLLWATGYNIVAIPLAAGVLYNFGISINPAVGTLFMTLSTVIVALNSRFIK
ncbi:MAG: heavy metal translocating P-type ATPase [Candidatus Dependentiae bacterium]|nr:heavy metal translocating P-type ATPase [Candidatus Dependentiae bacterium]